MSDKLEATSWLYVLVQNPGGDERIVGQYDQQSGISFIPAFLDKESAVQGNVHVTRERNHKYQIQAIILEDLQLIARDGQFVIFILDADGNIVDRLASPIDAAK